MRHEPLTSNTSVFPGAGEMAKHVRQVKCLPYRHDDLDSDPWYPCKSRVWSCTSGNLDAVERVGSDRWISGAL